MGIPDEDVARVRDATDIVALIGEHAALKRQGRRWVGLCPFHGEKTPSFSVNAEEGFYYCFGCGEKGDVISFVRAIEHLDFVDAVRRLADKAGLTIREDVGSGRDSQRRKIYFDAMERATEWYHDRLLVGADAGQARDYLRSRGYDGAVVRRFRLGWAPEGWDELCSGLGLTSEVATGSGLGFVNRRGRLQDAFRARILFPICDPSGHPVALGGRVLPGSSDPAKYKNSTETPIYSKRRTLYALNWAKQDIIKSEEVVVCEGYTDVIGLFGVGIERAVATCGTALAEEHVKLLRGFASRVVLAFDADGAGQSAASRFYEWEQRFSMDVAVADLPSGSDPGEMARSDPDGLRAAIEGAKPFLQFRVERILDAADLSTPEGRARAADAALGAVAEHPNDLVRDQYVMQIAERCRLEPLSVRERLEKRRREPRSDPGGSFVREPDDGGWDSEWDREGGPARAGAGDRSHRRSGGGGHGGRGRASSSVATAPKPPRPVDEFPPGLEALRLAIHRPDDVSHQLEAVLFRDGLQRSAFQALADADPEATLHQVIESSTPEVRSLLVRLCVEEPVGEPEEVVLQLVRDATRRELRVIAGEARTSQEARAEGAAAAGWLQELDDPVSSAEATSRLVAWLTVRAQKQTSGQGS